jgi:GNAT superfamily N-acetyltransferase
MRLVTLDERPDLIEADVAEVWPEFMFHDAVSAALWARLVAAFPQCSLLALDEGTGEPVAKATTFPFTADVENLPDGGYDAVILGAAADHLAGRAGTVLGAVEIAVRPDRRGTGLSGRMLDAARRNAGRLGYRDLVVALRPNHKHLVPFEPFSGYVRQTRDDGLPSDPWLRTHVRAGGRPVKVASRSMTIVGTLAQWRAWTGLPFDADGPVVVPQALVPVHCDVARDQAVYVEPNIWVHHGV